MYFSKYIINKKRLCLLRNREIKLRSKNNLCLLTQIKRYQVKFSYVILLVLHKTYLNVLLLVCF